MSIKRTSRGRKECSKRHPQYYKKRLATLKALGRTMPPRADKTMGGIKSLLQKWKAYCKLTNVDPDFRSSPPEAQHLKMFLQWTLDQYPGVESAGSLQLYWQQLKMHIADQTDILDDRINKDVLNFKQQLIDEYGLRKLARTKPVMGVDDLYHILFTHWVYDSTTYRDEHQRVQVATGILLASYTGCRPVSLFDTSEKKFVNGGTESDDTDNKGTESSDTDNKGTESSDTDNKGTVSSTTEPSDTESVAESDFDSESDIDDSTAHSNNSMNTHLGKTESICYNEIMMLLLRNSVPGGPNILAAKVTLIHTKGAKRRSESSVKTFLFEGENDPMFCVLDHLLALAVHDKAFEVDAINRDPSNIFRIKIPEHRNSLKLSWKSSMANIPLFRQPENCAGVWSTSATQPLKSSTWRRYLKGLGISAGLEHPFTQYVIRRGLMNAVNGKAPDSVRNQMFDHATGDAEGTTKRYLDQEVRYNTQAAFLERPSDGVVQRLARRLILTADRTAPTKCSDKGSKKVANNPKVNQLSKRTKALTKELRTKYGSVRAAPSTDPDLKEKISVDAARHTLKENLRNRCFARERRRHFKEADTLILEAQFNDLGTNDLSVASDTLLAPPTTYNLPERDSIVRLLCDQTSILTDLDKLARRGDTIQTMAALCTRQEATRRRQSEATPNYVRTSNLLVALPEVPNEYIHDSQETFPLVCRPTQCPICIGDERKTYDERMYEFARPSVMMDHVDKHLKGHKGNDPIPCHHPICVAKEVLLETVVHFKNHTAQVHRITLRA